MPDTVLYDGARFAQLPETILWHATLSDGAKLLWCTLQRHCGPEQTAWPGIKRLSALSRTSPRTTQRNLRELEAAGALRCQPVFDPQGRQRSNLYILSDLYVPPPPRQICPGVTPVAEAEDQNLHSYEGTMTPATPPRVSPVTPLEREPYEREKLARNGGSQRPSAPVSPGANRVAVPPQASKQAPPFLTETPEPQHTPNPQKALAFLAALETLAREEHWQPPTGGDADLQTLERWLSAAPLAAIEPVVLAKRLSHCRRDLAEAPGPICGAPEIRGELRGVLTSQRAQRATEGGVSTPPEWREKAELRDLWEQRKAEAPDQRHDRRIRMRRVAQRAGLLPPDAELDRPKTPAPRIKPLRLADGAAAVQSGPGGARDAPEP